MSLGNQGNLSKRGRGCQVVADKVERTDEVSLSWLTPAGSLVQKTIHLRSNETETFLEFTEAVYQRGRKDVLEEMLKQVKQ